MGHHGNGVLLGWKREGKAGVLWNDKCQDRRCADQWIQSCDHPMVGMRPELGFTSNVAFHVLAVVCIPGHFGESMDLTQTCECDFTWIDMAITCSQFCWSAMAGHDRPSCYAPPQDVWTHLRSFSCCSNFRTLLSSRQVSFCVWLRRLQMFQPVPACSEILRQLCVKFFRVDLNNWKILQEHVHLHCLYLLFEIMTNTCFDRFSQIAMEPSFLTMSYMARVSVLCSCFHVSCMFSNVLWSNVRKQHSTHAWWFCYCVNTFISMSSGNLRESPGLTVMFCANFISLQSREWRNLEIKCKTWSCLSMLKPFEKFEGFRTVLECEDLLLFSAIEARAAICGSAYSVLVVCSIATRGSFAESSCYSLWKSIIALEILLFTLVLSGITKTLANLRVCTFRNLTTGAIQATRLGESAKGNHQISPVFSGTEQILVNWGSFWVS